MIVCLIILFVLHIIEFIGIYCLVHYVEKLKSDLVKTIDCIDRVLTQIVSSADRVAEKMEETKDL